MRIFITIFAFYLFGLAILPCGDVLHGFCGVDADQCEVVLTDDASEEPDRDCEDEPCTPLCDCTCCANVFDFPEMLAFEDLEPTSPSIKLPQFQPQIAGILSVYDFWQPPRLG